MPKTNSYFWKNKGDWFSSKSSSLATHWLLSQTQLGVRENDPSLPLTLLSFSTNYKKSLRLGRGLCIVTRGSGLTAFDTFSRRVDVKHSERSPPEVRTSCGARPYEIASLALSKGSAKLSANHWNLHRQIWSALWQLPFSWVRGWRAPPTPHPPPRGARRKE